MFKAPMMVTGFYCRVSDRKIPRLASSANTNRVIQFIWYIYSATRETDQEIDEQFVRNRSNLTRIRRRVEMAVSTIISDINSHQSDSQGAGEEAGNLSESSGSEIAVSSTSTTLITG